MPIWSYFRQPKKDRINVKLWFLLVSLVIPIDL